MAGLRAGGGHGRRRLADAPRWERHSTPPPAWCRADDDAAALVRPVGEPSVVREPGVWWDAAAAVRRSVRVAVAHRAVDARELVPALVAGDDGGLDPEVADDFRTTGLTHLLAVCGTNLTLVVGSCSSSGGGAGSGAAGSMSWRPSGSSASCWSPGPSRASCGRRRWARSALVGMGRNGRRRGTRGLGVAVLVLLLVDPGLGGDAPASPCPCWPPAGSCSSPRPGATRWRAGCRAGSRRRSRCRWPPRWRARRWWRRSPGRSAWSRCGANLLAAPAVAPATVLGLAGGLLGLVWAPLGRRGRRAGGLVGRAGSSRSPSTAPTCPPRRWTWGTGPPRCSLLTGLCLVLVAAAPRAAGLAGRPRSACSGLLVAAVLVRPPTSGLAAGRLGARDVRRRPGRRPRPQRRTGRGASSSTPGRTRR